MKFKYISLLNSSVPQVNLIAAVERSSTMRSISPRPTLKIMEKETMAVATSPPLPPPPPPLLSFSEIPPWHQDNEHIRHGYRRTTGSARLCLASWSPRQLHNESLNIYTHLMPALVFLYLLFTFPSYLQTHYPQVTSADQWVFGIFLGSAAVCFGLSAGFHTLLCHSERVGRLWLMLDYAGIVVLTLGDFVSGVYVGFWCEKEFRWAYWGMVMWNTGCPFVLFCSVNYVDRIGADGCFADCFSRMPDASAAREPKVARSAVAECSRGCLCGYWAVWLCTSWAWNQAVWRRADEQAKRDALLPYGRWFACSRGSLLCGKLICSILVKYYPVGTLRMLIS